VKQFMAYYDRKLELTPAVFRRSNDAIAKALTGGRQLTRADLATSLERADVGITTGQRLGHLMMRAELDALVCSGGRRGKQFTYALLEERVPAVARLERDEALGELTRRYFATRGPATPHDFAWWSGLTLADAKRGVQIVGKALQRTTLDDREYWFTPGAMPKASSSAQLLPNYDEYFIGFKDRSAIGQLLRAKRVKNATSALQGHIITLDGQIVGGWKRSVAGKGAAVYLDLLTRLTRAEQAAIAAEASRLGEFLEAPIELRQTARPRGVQSGL
jgi:winged helix DNA-binding protein